MKTEIDETEIEKYKENVEKATEILLDFQKKYAVLREGKEFIAPLSTDMVYKYFRISKKDFHKGKESK